MESPVKSIFTRASPQSYLVALKPTSCSYLKMYFFKEKKNAATFNSYKIGGNFPRVCFKYVHI